jgi:hypothetical protein
MQNVLNHILKRKISTERIDNMASGTAVSALDRRVQHMLTMQSNQPQPPPKTFATLSNPIQKPQES